MTEPRRGTILFVHGFGSSSRCWSPLTDLLASDPRITDRYELRTWEYPTKWVELNLLGRIPRLTEIGRALANEIDSPAYRERPLTLVGHSQGGLVILSYFAELLQRGEGAKLRGVRQAIFFATPCEGSTTAISLRRLASSLFANPQELTLRVLNPDVADLRAVVQERIVSATRDSAVSHRVPIHAFCGLQDNVVPEASARGPFESVRHVPGNHFSIITPSDRSDRRYSELAELLLDPGGHLHRFEIDSDETVLSVEPRTRQTINTTSATNPRAVVFEDYGTMKRSVRFAPVNRCRDMFTLHYGTRKEGYVVGHESHRNEASPVDMGRWEDTGTSYQFDFTPEPGEIYCLDVDVYGGFPPGNREIHFHIGNRSYNRRLTYILNLSAYVGARYALTLPPRLFLQPDDVPHGDLCRNRDAFEPLNPTLLDTPGVFRWDLYDVDQGVVDIVWDVAAASAPDTRATAGREVRLG